MVDSMEFKQQFFARYASTHVTHRKGIASLETFRNSAPLWTEHFGGLLPPDRGSFIVDVGCGSGGLVWWLQQSGYHRAEGIDLSDEQVDLAHQLGVSNVRQADLRSFLAARPGKYDAILMRDVIEHFTRPEILEILAACRSALRPGGRIILQVPNAESPFFGRIRYGDFTHELAFSISSLSQLLSLAGLEDIRLFDTDPVLLGVKRLPRRILWQLVKGLYQLLLFAELGRGRRIVTQGIIAVGRNPPATA